MIDVSFLVNSKHEVVIASVEPRLSAGERTRGQKYFLLRFTNKEFPLLSMGKLHYGVACARAGLPGVEVYGLKAEEFKGLPEKGDWMIGKTAVVRVRPFVHDSIIRLVLDFMDWKR